MQPFEKITVLDLTHVLAGPFATYQLAVLGANVIKIEPPLRLDMARGDGADPRGANEGMGSEYQGQAANKRSLLLDLSSTDGRDVLLRLVQAADVLVENYVTGALEALGLGAEVLMALNPRLIYCSMTGFGQSGAKRSDPAYDNVIQAYSGMMAATGTPESGPLKVGPPVLDYATGAQAAFAITAALFQRTHTGRGQRIDVAMLDAALIAMSCNVMGTFATGTPPRRTGNACAFPGYAAYQASDALLMIGAYSTPQHRRLYLALGLGELAAEIPDDAPVLAMTERAGDIPRIAAVIRTRTADFWEKRLNENRVPAARVRTLDEALNALETLERRVIQTLERPDGTKTKFPVAAFLFGNGGPTIRTLPPRAGQHTEEVLSEFGFSPDEVAGLKASGVVA